MTLDPDFEQALPDEVRLSEVGADGLPGDSRPSDDWPGMAPGDVGVLNALSPKHGNWADLVDVDPKPPVLWVLGSSDVVVANGSAWDMGTLGQAGAVPGWPGEEAWPPQPMVHQIADVLDAYEQAGGTVRTEWSEGSGHGPFLDAPDRSTTVPYDFLAGAS